VVSSDEHLLTQQALDKIRAKARADGFVEREILTVERSFKWGALLAANQSLSLFGDKKIIDLRIPTGKPGKDGAQALQEYVTQLNANPNPEIGLGQSKICLGDTLAGSGSLSGHPFD
jgi:DNA polymerase-3 subunit delta